MRGDRRELGWRAGSGADPEGLPDDGEEFGLCCKGDGSPGSILSRSNMI